MPPPSRSAEAFEKLIRCAKMHEKNYEFSVS